ncbi:MAG: D-alanyl-D-alanine carboxypeptidase family protein [Christensenellales bacterium]|jgi:D-alanyl-D-alanine carboxypeptidase (penicillin-binding protein 5/6)
MKKIATLLAAFLMLASLSSPVYAEDNNKVDASAALVMEVETGRVLYEQNADQSLPMASTTKIMTALVALEDGNLDDTVTVSANASGVEGSSLYLKIGEKIKLRDLLYGLMLQSGNDAAVAIAEHVGGSLEGFMEMMNRKAQELGASGSQFTNPHGLSAEGHYTTARDLAVISAAALRHELFAQIVSTKYHEIAATNKTGGRALKNKNKLLWNYEGGSGIKTGYTKNAGRCLVSSAEKEDMQVVCVVLNCYNMFEDSIQLLDNAYGDYGKYPVFEKGAYLKTITIEDGVEETLDAYVAEDTSLPLTWEEFERVECRVTLPATLQAPVEPGQELGTLEAWLDGELVASQKILADKEIEKISLGYLLRKIINNWYIPSFEW